MTKATNAAWEKLQSVMHSNGIDSLNELAERLGLDGPEILWDIRNGVCDMPSWLTGRIAETFPAGSDSGHAPGEKIPVYLHSGTSRFETRELPDDYVVLPKTVSPRIIFCTICNETAIRDEVPGGSYVFLEKPGADHITYGKPYMLEIDGQTTFRIVEQAASPDRVKLVSSFPSYKSTEIELSRITSALKISSVFRLTEDPGT